VAPETGRWKCTAVCLAGMRWLTVGVSLAVVPVVTPFLLLDVAARRARNKLRVWQMLLTVLVLALVGISSAELARNLLALAILASTPLHRADVRQWVGRGISFGLMALLFVAPLQRVSTLTSWRPVGGATTVTSPGQVLTQRVSRLHTVGPQTAALYTIPPVEVASEVVVDFTVRLADAPMHDMRSLRLGLWWPSDTTPPSAFPSAEFVVSNEWRSVSFTRSLPSSAVGESLTVFMSVDASEPTSLDLTRPLVALVNGGQVLPQLNREGGNRIGLTSGGPNLAGHSVVAAAMLHSVLARSVWHQLWSLVPAMGLVILTGSRAALTALLLAQVLKGLRRLSLGGRSQRRRILTTLAIPVLVLGAGYLLGVVRSPVVDNPGTRLSIWRAAIEAIVAYPQSGLRGQGMDFPEWWQEQEARRGLLEVPPRHAHNWWLHVGSSHGAFALALSLVAASLIAFCGWRRVGPTAVVFLVPFAALGSLDSSLAFSGVLFPMWTGVVYLLNARNQTGRW
jgi:hypothetical protein